MAFIWRDDDPEKGQKTPDEIMQAQNDFWQHATGPIDAIILSFQRIFDYKGYSNRSEYWWFVLILGIINALSFQASEFILKKILSPDDAGILVLSIFFSAVVALVTLFAWLPLATRRIRDAGRNPRIMFLYPLSLIIPLINIIVKDEYQTIILVVGSIIYLSVALITLIIFIMPSSLREN